MNDRYTIQYAQIKFYIREHRLQAKFITSYRPILRDLFVMIFVFDSPIYFFLAEDKEKQPFLLFFDSKVYWWRQSCACASGKYVNIEIRLSVAICDTRKEEYNGDTGKRKAKLRDRVCRRHIQQPQYHQLKTEKYL